MTTNYTRKYSTGLTMSICCAFTALLFVATPAAAQTNREVAVYTKTDVRDLVQRMERHSNEFRKHFEKALDRSALDGTDREDRLRRWTQDLEDMLDHFKDDYNKGGIRNMEDRVNTLLAIAAGINRVMLYRTFDQNAARDWEFVRSDLNALALTYGLPTLQSYRIGGYSQAVR